MPDYADALRTAVDAARAAGELLRRDFHRPGGPRGAGDHADADTEAERLIRQRLLAAFPSWDYLGEETGGQGGDGSHRWLVDPNDGTAAYLKGFRGSAVSIGLVRGGVPVLGVVYAFAYPDDAGDLIAWAEGCGPLTRNGVVAEVSPRSDALEAGSVVLVSQDADREPAGNTRCVAPARFVAVPSIAYRLALVAVGEAVAGVSLSGPGDWDYAGGHALLRTVGGVILDEDAREVGYGSDMRRSRWCFGGLPAAARELAGRPWGDVARARPSGTIPLARLTPGETVPDAALLSRAQGCWLGQLTGDALGSLVEFQPPWVIAEHYPDGPRRLADGGVWSTLAGQPTDDSELALMLARRLVAGRGYDKEAVFAAYRHWYESGPFDIGGTTRRALRGDEPDEESQANGSLMRISPLGIAGGGRGPNGATWAAEWARIDSELTHPNAVCREACAAFVAAVATAVRTGDARAAYAAAVAEASRPGGQDAVRRTLAVAEHEPPKDFTRQQGWVLIALQNAFFRLLHPLSTFEQGVVATVRAGGDTDTNGAIAGALLGAVHGREAVPRQWRRAVLCCRPLPEAGARQPRPMDFWPVDAVTLAEKLLLCGRDASPS